MRDEKGDSLMFVTIRDDTWNVRKMEHLIPNLKIWDYSDIPGGGPPTCSKVATTLEKPPTPPTRYVQILSSLPVWYLGNVEILSY